MSGGSEGGTEPGLHTVIAQDVPKVPLVSVSCTCCPVMASAGEAKEPHGRTLPRPGFLPSPVAASHHADLIAAM